MKTHYVEVQEAKTTIESLPIRRAFNRREEIPRLKEVSKAERHEKKMAEQSHITQGKISQKKFQGLENELKEAKRSSKDAKDDLEAAEVDAKKARLELAGTERCTEPDASKLRIDVLNNDNLFCQIASESGDGRRKRAAELAKAQPTTVEAQATKIKALVEQLAKAVEVNYVTKYPLEQYAQIRHRLVNQGQGWNSWIREQGNRAAHSEDCKTQLLCPTPILDEFYELYGACRAIWKELEQDMTLEEMCQSYDARIDVQDCVVIMVELRNKASGRAERRTAVA
ncbi:uncharacterized protein RAG0_13743 [Rhynchosporium agropyri]|uniref:Uncharacterized protein n=1 Tax=Rhynchosporium agropyri TaxID=914238 RepID=A0A1E1LDX6_9HELO|nr:uncharacterized protein RAG0_13743 [Rhynchosporium agropyri]